MNTRALVAEFIGTFALCFIGILAIHANPGLPGVALAHGLTIAVFATAFGAISGAHFNPAVTVAFLTVKKISSKDAAMYIASQLLAGLVAAFVCTLYVQANGVAAGTPAVATGVSIGAAIAAEFIATFFLMTLIMAVATDKRVANVGGLYIGLAVMIGIFGIGQFTGAAMNPARWFGPALVGGQGVGAVGVYVGATILGAAAAAQVWKMMFAEPESATQ